MAGCSKDMRWTPNPADKLTDDLLVEILSRVPYKSLCRFKCVSRRWRGIISHPDHRKVLAQYHLDSLAGFVHSSYDHNLSGPPIHHYTSFSEGIHAPIRSSLPFLPNYVMFIVLDSCNGLLLCSCFKTIDSRSFNYLVCNPATEKWVVLPGWFYKVQPTRLGFEPAVSSHFHVFQFEENGAPNVYGYADDSDDDHTERYIKGVDIYSSKTGIWSHKDNCLAIGFRIVSDLKSVFANGVLYLVVVESAVVTVDVEGSTWRMIPMPQNDSHYIDIDVGFIGLSQGCLYFANTDHPDDYENKLSIWVLEDYDSEQWILKYTIRYFNLFGVNTCSELDYSIVAIHPEQDTIYLVYGDGNVLMYYEMDSKKVCYIHDLGSDSKKPYHPYAPLYSESLADGH